jgi:hypothetical protein
MKERIYSNVIHTENFMKERIYSNVIRNQNYVLP